MGSFDGFYSSEVNEATEARSNSLLLKTNPIKPRAIGKTLPQSGKIIFERSDQDVGLFFDEIGLGQVQ